MADGGGAGRIKTVAAMMAITLAGKTLGLFRDSMIGSHYGTASVEGAAFNVALMLPRNFFDVLFASAITASFIPVFNGMLVKEGREKAFALSHRFVSLILVATTAATALLILAARPVMTLYAGSLAPEIIPLATELVRYMFPIIILSGLAFSLTGVLQSLGQFNIPAAMGLVSNGVILIYFIFFMERAGVRGLTAAILLGWAAQFLIQVPFLLKNKYGFRFRPPKPRELIGDEHFRQIGKLTLPVLVVAWVMPVNQIANANAALRDVTGIQAQNAVILANQLYMVITGVIVLSISNFIFPRLSRQSAENDGRGFGATLNQTVRAVFFLLAPVSVALMCLSEPLVRLYLERGNFDAQSTALTSRALFYFAIGIPGYGLTAALSHGFYAAGKGRAPLLIGICAMLCNFILGLVLVRFLGTGGPALASSVSVTVSAAAMLVILNGYNNEILDKKLLSDVMKMVLAGLVMAPVVLASKGFILNALADGLPERFAAVVLPALLGAAAYILIIYKDLKKCVKSL